MNRLVVWGGTDTRESHRHIHRAFYENALKLGYDALWVDDAPGTELLPEDVVIAVDIWSRHLPFHPDVDYVLHNVGADHPVIQQADPARILRLQVWTTDSFGEPWDRCRAYAREHRILFQPWGTNLLQDEFMEPVFNPDANTVIFIGAIWSDVRESTELGNVAVIEELKDACAEQGLAFEHYTQISEIDMVRLSRKARIAPTILGRWQCEHGYLPCRAFKHASWGIPVLTNSAAVAELFGDETVDLPAGDLLADALDASEEQWLGWAASDQTVAQHYTYRESIESILRALEEGRDADGGPFLAWRQNHHLALSLQAIKLEVYEEILRDTLQLLPEAASFMELTPSDESLHYAVALRTAGERIKSAL